MLCQRCYDKIIKYRIISPVTDDFSMDLKICESCAKDAINQMLRVPQSGFQIFLLDGESTDYCPMCERDEKS